MLGLTVCLIRMDNERNPCVAVKNYTGVLFYLSAMQSQ